MRKPKRHDCVVSLKGTHWCTSKPNWVSIFFQLSCFWLRITWNIVCGVVTSCSCLAKLLRRISQNDRSALIEELRRFILCDRRVTILTSSAKSNVSVSRTSGKSFTKRRNRSGPIAQPCGTPLSIRMTPECSPPTCTLKTRPERYASI